MPIYSVITILDRQGREFTINAISTADARDGVLTAINDLNVSWGRPHAMAPQEPGEASFELMQRRPVDATPLSWDALVTVDVLLANHMCRVVHGHIDRWVRDDSDPDWVTWTVVVQDILGRADSTRMGDTPWPADQPAAVRLQRINTSSPAGPLVNPDLSGNWSPNPGPLAARDVDNRSALELINLTLGTCLTAESADGLVGIRKATGARITWPTAPSAEAAPDRGISITRLLTPARIPADAIEAGPRVLDRSGVLTRIAVQHPDDTTTSVQGSRSSIAQASLSIQTDEQTVPPNLPALYRRILDASAYPVERLPTWTLVPERIIQPELWRLITVGERTNVVVTIPDAPEWMGSNHIINAGQLSIRDGAFSLTLAPAPAATGGNAPMQWSEVPPLTSSTEPGTVLRPLMFSDLGEQQLSNPPTLLDYDLTI